MVIVMSMMMTRTVDFGACDGYDADDGGDGIGDFDDVVAS